MHSIILVLSGDVYICSSDRITSYLAKNLKSKVVLFLTDVIVNYKSY